MTAVAVSTPPDTVPVNVPVNDPSETVPVTSLFDWVRLNVIGSVVPAGKPSQKPSKQRVGAAGVTR